MFKRTIVSVTNDTLSASIGELEQGTWFSYKDICYIKMGRMRVIRGEVSCFSLGLYEVVDLNINIEVEPYKTIEITPILYLFSRIRD